MCRYSILTSISKAVSLSILLAWSPNIFGMYSSLHTLEVHLVSFSNLWRGLHYRSPNIMKFSHRWSISVESQWGVKILSLSLCHLWREPRTFNILKKQKGVCCFKAINFVNLFCRVTHDSDYSVISFMLNNVQFWLLNVCMRNTHITRLKRSLSLAQTTKKIKYKNIRFGIAVIATTYFRYSHLASLSDLESSLLLYCFFGWFAVSLCSGSKFYNWIIVDLNNSTCSILQKCVNYRKITYSALTEWHLSFLCLSI